jgi:hypothetical protein
MDCGDWFLLCLSVAAILIMGIAVGIMLDRNF